MRRKMPLWTKIYAIFDRNRARFPKKSKAQKHIQIDTMLRSDFFSENALGPEFWIFLGFTDKGLNPNRKNRKIEFQILTEIWIFNKRSLVLILEKQKSYFFR